MAEPFRIEAESLDIIEGFKVESLEAASGGQTLKAENKATESRAEFTFSGENGIYDLDVGHFDEADGMATLTILVNGVEVGSFLLDQDLGSDLAGDQTHTVRRIGDVSLQPGDVIQILGMRDGGEPVRTDYIDFTKQEGAEPPSLEVDTTFDVVDATDGLTSLREAIGLINDGTFAPGDVITFADGTGEAFEGGGTILQAAGSDALTITQSMTIDGDLDDDGTPDVTVDAQKTSRVFTVDDGDETVDRTVVLDGLVITNGIIEGFKDGGGGGVLNNEILTVTNSSVIGNHASSSDGGGIVNRNSLLVSDSLIEGNSARNFYSSGGGIFNSGDATVTRSIIRDNSSGPYGGGAGIFNNSQLTVVDSTISGNQARGYNGYGGGINQSGGSLVLIGSTVSDNIVKSGEGGGLFISYRSTSSVRIENSTISGNDASGVYVSYNGAELDIYNSTIVDNEYDGINSNGNGTIRIASSIVAANDGSDISGAGSDFTSLGNNLIGNGDGADGAFQDGVLGDIVGTTAAPVDPLLLPLRMSGGPTATQEPRVDSPILDAGSNPVGLTTDQRGEARDVDLPGVGATPDIGAVELTVAEFEAPPPATSLTVDTTADVVDPNDGLTSLREAIEAINRGFFAPGSAIDFADGPGEAFADGGTIALNGTALDVAEAMIIDGDLNDDGTPDVVIDAGGASRVVTVAAGSGYERGVTLNGLVLTDGGTEGGIRNQEALTLSNSVVRDSAGTGVMNTGDLTLVQSTIDAHVTGIFNDEGALRISDSTISNNQNSGLSNSTGYLAGWRDKEVVIANTTISGNGYGDAPRGDSAGINNFNGRIYVYNSTVTQNRYGIDPGTDFEGPPLSYGDTRISSSIVAGNQVDFGYNSEGAVSLGNNLIGDGSAFVDGVNGDIVGIAAFPIDPLLGPLSDNGGPTRTHLPDSFSPALDAGANLLELTTDQRGEARDTDIPGLVGTTDIGAVELRLDEFEGPPRPPETPSLEVSTAQDILDAFDGLTSLREAIGFVNDGTFAPGSTIKFDDGPGGAFEGGGTILLAPLSEDLRVNESMTIDGDLDDDGLPDVTIDGSQRDDRVFGVTGYMAGTDPVVVFDGLTITGGSVPSGESGGGIRNYATLTILNSAITGNVANRGGGIASRGNLTVENSTISDNQGSSGGGIYSGRDSNQATAYIANSTLSGNTATNTGGGILNRGTLMIYNSTLTENSAPAGSGGGIAALFGGINSIQLTSTIVAGNVGTDVDRLDGGIANQFQSLGNNLIGNGDGADGAFQDGVLGDIVGTTAAPVDPLLGPLAPNGGPTLTHLPQVGSPALDAGANLIGLTTDQRGEAREVDLVLSGGVVDIGAVEAQQGPPAEPFRIEAENLTRDVAFKVKNLAPASANQVLQADGSAEQRASYVFDRPAGTYALTIGYFDENDGVSSFAVFVDGVEIGNWLWDEELGSAFADNMTATTHTIQGVNINQGEVIEFVGMKDGGEPLRFDFIDFAPTGPVTDTAPPQVETASAPGIGNAQAGSPSAEISVTYSDNVALDVSSFDTEDIRVTGPGGIDVDVTGFSVDTPSDGTPRTVTYTIAAPGGTWDPTDNGNYSVSLDVLEVFDTAFNEAEGIVDLASFTVAIDDQPPPAFFRKEAEDFDILTSYTVKSLAVASGDAVLQAVGSGEKRASYIFDQPTGNYDLKIGYFDENDGEASFRLLVDGVEIDSFLWDQDLGSPLAIATTATTRDVLGVSLQTGSVIEAIGQKDGREPARFDYIDFIGNRPVLNPFPTVLELSDLNGSNGFVISGLNSGDEFYLVANAGDINGDGGDDFVVGAPRASPDGKHNAGETYVIFGTNDGFEASFDLSALDGTNGFVINGIEVLDVSGVSVSAAGDVNGDGIGDLIIGANFADPDGNDEAGETYVLFGSADGFDASFELASLDGDNGFAINGIESGDNAGHTVSSAGDINGDGIDDIAIVARFADSNGVSNAGEAYVVFGTTDGFEPTFNLADLNGENGFSINGIEADNFLFRVSDAGDINGDGIDDLLVSSRRADPNGEIDAGETYVIFGSTDGFDADLSLASLDGGNGFVIEGIDAGDFSGISVSGVGDINGDGIDDLAIGGWVADPNGVSDAGETYVVFGTTGGFDAILELANLNGDNGFTVNGVNAGDMSGVSVSGVGDINGDGIDDLLIGANGAAPDGKELAGGSYVVFGSEDDFGASFELASLDGRNGFVINGISAGDGAGISVSGAGDINGDGYDDLLIGAREADPNGNERAGEVYVIYGQDTFSPAISNEVPFAGTDEFSFI